MVYAVRYPAVFWNTNKTFSFLFSSALLFNGVQVIVHIHKFAMIFTHICSVTCFKNVLPFFRIWWPWEASASCSRCTRWAPKMFFTSTSRSFSTCPSVPFCTFWAASLSPCQAVSSTCMAIKNSWHSWRSSHKNIGKHWLNFQVVALSRHNKK